MAPSRLCLASLGCPIEQMFANILQQICKILYTNQTNLCFPIDLGPQDLSRKIKRNENKIICLKKSQTIIPSIENSIFWGSASFFRCYISLNTKWNAKAWHGMPRHAMACLGMPRHDLACHGMPWHAIA